MKTGYHVIYARDFFDGIDDAQSNGFDFAQFDLGVPKFFLNDLTDSALREIRDYAADKNVQITFHAPGDNVSLFCDYSIIRGAILDEFTQILDKANTLNARHVTFHAGIYPRFRKSGTKTFDLNADHYGQVLYDNLAHLTARCGGVLVCLENYQWDGVTRQAVTRLIDDKNALYLTLDTAKLYKDRSAAELNGDDLALFVKYRDRIREMHIHDMNRDFGSHQTVGTGAVDFSMFRQFLSEQVYLNFEVRPVEAAKTSKDRLLEMWDI